jgi:hypothetical protein
MPQRLLLATMVSLSELSTVHAQNYDSDSVYYTPIERPKQKNKNAKMESGQTSRGVEYFFAVQTGSLIGCNNCGNGEEFTFSAATLQGVTIGKKFRTGIGVALDSYQNWHTLPVYGMISWDLIGSKNRNAVFLQMAYGWAHPWFVRDGAYSTYTSDPFTGVKGGRMINPQIGYRIRYYDLKLSISIGYKFQRIFYSSAYSSYIACPMCAYPYPISTNDITQDMNRVQLVMSAGWK